MIKYQRIYSLLILVLFCSVLQAQKPNILLIVSDDLNTRIGPYMEIDKHTPNLDRLATEGVKFSNTYCQYPLCGPSRASLMSGLYPETNGILGNSHVIGSYRKVTPALADHPSLAGFFKENGYYSARVSKIYHMGVPGGIERGDPGGDDPDSWDYAYNVLGPETLSQGELELLSPGNLHYGSNFARMILANELEDTQTDYLAASQAIAILENRAAELAQDARNKVKAKPESPFFLAVGLVRPHVPLIAPENCFEPYPENEVELPQVVVADNVPALAMRRQNDKIWKMNETQKRQTIGAYMASVRFMDQQVGRLLDALDRLDLREETIVIFISDHGYNLGEHDCWSKVSLWEGSIRIPMIISYPGGEMNYGTTYRSITELIDLYPTLTELCGLSAEQPEILQGRSLAPYLMGTAVIKEESLAYTVTNGGRAASIRSQRWRYNRWGENIEVGNEELYDHLNDPEEHINLAQDANSQQVLDEMREKFDSARKKAYLSLIRSKI
ncbi:MAG: sulfatase [Bacteroidota bacterium]|nr:sulfatase [Bacteroidota bacterium]